MTNKYYIYLRFYLLKINEHCLYCLTLEFFSQNKDGKTSPQMRLVNNQMSFVALMGGVYPDHQVAIDLET